MPEANDQSPRDHRHPVGKVLRLVHVVGRQQDRLAELAQVVDRPPGPAPGRGIEPGRRFVEKDQVGVTHDPQDQLQPALLPAGQGFDPGVRLLGDADDLHQLARRATFRIQRSVGVDGLTYRQFLLDRGRLQNDADLLAKVSAGGLRVDTQHTDRARGAGTVSLENLHRCRLARTVRAEESKHFPR